MKNAYEATTIKTAPIARYGTGLTVGIAPDGVEVCGIRIGGPGLCNLLWLWAKCIVFAELTGAKIVEPTWTQVKPRALLRGERSMGIYWRPFQTQSSELYIRRPDRRVPTHRNGEHYLELALTGRGDEIQSGHYLMTDISDPFCSLTDWRHTIRYYWSLLVGIKARKSFNISSEAYVAVHVRRGDFVRVGLSTDLDHVQERLRLFSAKYPLHQKVILTDANYSDIEFWKAVPSEYLNVSSNDAVQDLVVMIEADDFIGTERSSFSRFASFIREP